MTKNRSALATSITLFGVVLALAIPGAARAHGLLGHIHVTGWAIENLPPGELREFFEDPEVFQAALMGATFPDTGYALSDPAGREYAEHAHWEPFIEAFIQHVRTTYGPTYTKDERLIVAFLLGCASHGLQDELFDSTFMFEAEQRDGESQGSLDPGTDGFLVQDGHHRMAPGVYPDTYVPMMDLLSLFSTLPRTIDQPLIELHVRVVTAGYVNGEAGLNFARYYGDMYRPVLPWASTHYLDAEVAGSHRAEILPTGRHMQALWDRLHDRFDEQDLVVHAWPEDTRRLREAESDSVASWVTLVLGKGIVQDSATGSITDGAGTQHPFALSYTRWGGTSRIVRFRPTEDFVPGGHYTVTLDAGATLVDGSVTSLAYTHDFQVACATPDDANCPALAPVPDPTIDTPLVPSSGGGCSAGRGATSPSLIVLALVALAASRKKRTR